MARRKYSKWSAGAIDIAGVGNTGISGGSGVEGITSENQEMPGVVVRKSTLKKDGARREGPSAEDKLRKIANEKESVVLQVDDEDDPLHGGPQRTRNELPKRTDTSVTTDQFGRVAPTSPQGHGELDSIIESTALANSGNPRPKPREKVRRVREAEIDVLYENQRGLFCCGIPLFSSRSLLNFDPSSWQTRDFKDSPVSILDKQCPDPSWEWAWKTWYVDMTADVDDQGWMYSFSFNPYFSWHGNHVWFHSFVRRRRWLRKRVKVRPGGELPSPNGDEAHGLNPDYFTIHSQQKHGGPGSTAAASWRMLRQSASVGGAGWGGNADDNEHEEEEEITDVPQLMKRLRKCTLDREKIRAIDRFVEEGGVEITYLVERMPSLMSLLIFQDSRRKLLAHLNSAYYKAEEAFTRDWSTADESHVSTSPTLPTPYSAESKRRQDERRLEALKEAVKVADQEVKKLEFWSDIKEVVVQGHSSGGQGKWGEGWDGVDKSGPEVMGPRVDMGGRRVTKGELGEEGKTEEEELQHVKPGKWAGVRRDKGKGRAE
ncbi:hypothetical protein BDZ91DRAFT_515670 [Kalaharituber pfeilii]|nr:hypothetical protein BDZ91DRAFT_515670 [Kalaharituber pfeilii]